MKEMNAYVLVLIIALFTIGLVVVAAVAMLIILGIHTVEKDRTSKEQMFQLQMTAAKSKNLKDALSPTEMYKIVDDMIHFYVSRTIVLNDFEGKTDGELSILLDNELVHISTEVELHLSEQFKRSWETYFDPVEGTEDSMSHLRLYISYGVRADLVKLIETIKNRKSLRLRTNKKKNPEETASEQ